VARLELLGFQQEAADRLVESALNYYEGGPDRIGGRTVPYVGQLKAVTGAGKTPILATVAGRVGPAIVLWTYHSKNSGAGILSPLSRRAVRVGQGC